MSQRVEGGCQSVNEKPLPVRGGDQGVVQKRPGSIPGLFYWRKLADHGASLGLRFKWEWTLVRHARESSRLSPG